MTAANEADRLLVERIRRGDEQAWNELIGRFEGRLLAFAESRLRDRTVSEDIVQETFIGFLNSLPNYDRRRALENYLFTIAAYKLTDHLRREGRRPAIPLSAGANSSGEWDLEASNQRGASSIVRSVERKRLEEAALVEALSDELARWRERGDWQKVKCAELLFVRGIANKEAARELGLTEQQVANYKFDFIARMSQAIRKQGLSVDVFPELHATEDNA